MNMTWRKSSYSSVNGGNCVEVGVWRKSSYSTSNGGNCVEVGAWQMPAHISVTGGECVEVGAWQMPADSSVTSGGYVEAGSAVSPAVATDDGRAIRAGVGKTPHDAIGAAVASNFPGNIGTTATGGFSSAPWRKSTRSTGNGGSCVETATIGAAVAVRDTKDNGVGPVLRFPPRAWQAFTATLK
jgi:hypothetical protein